MLSDMGVRAKKRRRQKCILACVRACARVLFVRGAQRFDRRCRLRSHSRFQPCCVFMSALDVVLGGKYSGSTYATVADSDRGYCHWIMNANSLSRSLRPFRTWLNRAYGGVFCFGKHRNAFYSEIYKDHPEYTIWACELDGPSDALRHFQAYVRRRDEETASEEAASKRKRARGPPESEATATQASSMECRICYDRPIDVLLLPCRHLVCCQVCSALSATCPVCRGRVSETFRVYLG